MYQKVACITNVSCVSKGGFWYTCIKCIKSLPLIHMYRIYQKSAFDTVVSTISKLNDSFVSKWRHKWIGTYKIHRDFFTNFLVKIRVNGSRVWLTWGRGDSSGRAWRPSRWSWTSCGGQRCILPGRAPRVPPRSAVSHLRKYLKRHTSDLYLSTQINSCWVNS